MSVDMQLSSENCSFFFLQGFYGFFFWLLVDMVVKFGVEIWWVGFNVGDQVFWLDMLCYIFYCGDLFDWFVEFIWIVDEKNVMDVVLYGDICGVYVEVVWFVKVCGLIVYIFEEGYLCFFWVIYECDGLNGYL